MIGNLRGMMAQLPQAEFMAQQQGAIGAQDPRAGVPAWQTPNNSGYLAGASLGAGLGGLLAGQKNAIPGMLGGAALGMGANALNQAGGFDSLKNLFR